MDNLTLILIILLVITISALFFSCNRENMSVITSDELYSAPYKAPTEYCATVSTGDIYNFIHKLPADKYGDIVKEFGEPTVRADEPNGFMLWKSPGFFEEILLRDESIEDSMPKQHCDFLYVTVNVHVPYKLLSSVLALSPTISYNALKNELTVMCNDMLPAVMTLYLALTIINKPNTAKQVYNDFRNALLSVNPVTNKSIMEELEIMVRNNQKDFAQFMPNRTCSIVSRNYSGNKR